MDVCVDLVRSWTRFEICLVAMVTRVGICCYGYQSWILLLLRAPEISESSSDTLFLSLFLALDLFLFCFAPHNLSLAILPAVLHYNVYSRFVNLVRRRWAKGPFSNILYKSQF